MYRINCVYGEENFLYILLYIEGVTVGFGLVESGIMWSNSAMKSKKILNKFK